jgi:hypothetical protein
VDRRKGIHRLILIGKVGSTVAGYDVLGYRVAKGP